MAGSPPFSRLGGISTLSGLSRREKLLFLFYPKKKKGRFVDVKIGSFVVGRTVIEGTVLLSVGKLMA